MPQIRPRRPKVDFSTLPILLGLLLFSQPQAQAEIVPINFDGLSDGDIVTSQFPGLTFQNAIVLTAAVSLNEFEFPPRSGPNVVSDNGGQMVIDFTAPVLSFAGYFTYLAPLTLTAFDAGGGQVGQAVSAFNANMGLSGDPGSSPNELLSLAFGAGISRVTIAGDPFGGSFTLDDATYQTPDLQAVPEPKDTLLLLTAACVLIGLRRHTLRNP